MHFLLKLFGLFFVCGVVFSSGTKTIICDQDTYLLSQLFSQHWEWLSQRGYYISYVKKAMPVEALTGTLHTISTELPADKNPHLRFAEIYLVDIPHYGIWHIDCRYTIGNPLMQDLADGYLHMIIGLSDTAYQCKQVDKATVVC